MKLSPQERIWVESLRKKERMWRWIRWIDIAVGAGLFAASWRLFVTADQGLREAIMDSGDPIDFMIFSSAYPFSFLGVIAAAGFIGWAIGNWRGNTTRILLLKLYDELDESALDHVSDPN